jgi:hypothetical protein
MEAAPWETATRERVADDAIDLEPTAIVVRQQQHVQRSELDLAAMCEVARTMGTRDRKEMLAQAREVGSLLGSQLKPDGSCVAYYSWEQGGKLIEGPTVDLMEALAEVWGRVVKQVEIIDYAPPTIRLTGIVVDLVTLSVTKRPFVGAVMQAPAKFQKGEQRARWDAMQMQSAVSKAIRGALEHALPDWLQRAAVDAAKVAHARAVLGQGDLESAIGKAVEWLGSKGLSVDALVALLEVPRDSWRIEQVAQLKALAVDLKDGRRTVAQVLAQVQAQPAPQPDGDRLGSLGLGKPAAQGTQAPPPPPPPSPSSPPPGRDGSGSPASGDGQKPKDPIKDALIEELRGLYRDHEALVSNACRLQATEPRSLGRCGVEKLAAIRDAVRAGIAATQPKTDQWDAMEGQALVAVLEALAARLPADVVSAIWTRHEVPDDLDTADVATETQRALVRELVAAEQRLKAEAAAADGGQS